MNASHWILYLFLTFTIVFCPGPMTLFTMANGIKMGYRRTFFAIIGGSTAYIIQMGIVALGIGLILQKSEVAFAILKYSGALYLLYLGVKQWRSTGVTLQNTGAVNVKSSGRMYLNGFFIGISNPKAIIVFTVMFPQFINPQIERTHQLLILGITFLVAQFISASVYATLGAQVYSQFQKMNKEKLQCRIFGFMLIAIGISLAMVKVSNGS